MFGVLDGFFPPFLKKFDERKTHNVFALMLNPRYKNLIIVSTFVGKELGVGVVKWQEGTLPFAFEDLFIFAWALFNSGFVAKKASDGDSDLDNFEMYARTIEPSKEVLKQKVDLLKRYHDIEDIKCPLD